MGLFRCLIAVLSLLLVTAPLLAQSGNPSVEVVLSTDQAQKGDTIYADVVIHNAHNIGGADIGITASDCLRVVERQPGNFLPSSSDEGGFSPFEESSDHATRLAASIINRARIVSGDGVFYRVKLEVICDDAAPEVIVTFAQLITINHPTANDTELISYKIEQGNLPVSNDMVEVQPGAAAVEAVAVPTLVPLEVAVAQASAPSTTNVVMLVALVVMGTCVIGMIVLLLVQQRRRTRGA